MKKILKIAPASIHTFSHNIVLLTILETSSLTEPWILSHYTNLFFTRKGNTGDFFSAYDGDWQYFEHKTCPWIRYLRYDRNLLRDHCDIINLCKSMINNDTYVYVCVDEYYISNYTSGNGKSHFLHPVFIYGYDDEEQMFYVADHFSNGVFSSQKIRISEFQTAYNSEFQEQDFLEGIVGMQLRKSSACFHIQNVPEMFELNISKIIEDIKSYLCINSIYKTNDHYYVGIQYYNALMSVIHDKKAGNEYEINVRMFCTLLDHKIMMKRRIEYMLNHAYIASNHVDMLNIFKSIEQNTLLLLRLVVKYGINPSHNLLDRMEKLITSICDVETKTLMQLLKLF